MWFRYLFFTKSERGFYDASCFFPPSVFEGRRCSSPFHRCCRAAEQLRRLLCGQHCRNRRQHHLHSTVCPSARHPELPDLLCRPGPVPRHPLRRHAGGVRQPRQDPRRSCHQLGVGRRHPDMDFPPAGRELGGLYRRSAGPRDRAGLCGRAGLSAGPGLRFRHCQPCHPLCGRGRGLL